MVNGLRNLLDLTEIGADCLVPMPGFFLEARDVERDLPSKLADIATSKKVYRKPIRTNHDLGEPGGADVGLAAAPNQPQPRDDAKGVQRTL